MTEVTINRKKFIEAFGFLMAQKFTEKAPKRTGRLARSFLATLKVKDGIITFQPPKYFKFVEYGTSKQRANPFVRDTLFRETESIARQALKIATTINN